MSLVVQSSPVPSRHAIRELLEGMTGRDIQITDGDPITAKATNVIAVYVNKNLGVQAVGVVDLGGAARLGGALGMLPIGGVEDAIDEKQLTGAVHDNCYEVLNVLSAVYNTPNAPHVKLYEMYGPGDEVPGDIVKLTQLMGARMDLAFEISGYGPGFLSLVSR